MERIAQIQAWCRTNVTFGNAIAVSMIAGLIYLLAPERVIGHPPGVLVSKLPIQGPAISPPQSFPFKGYTITLLAPYDITARVLARQIYRADAASALAPLDLAVGWGIMSDSAVVDDITYHLAMRYYSFRTTKPLDFAKVNPSFANMHLIPQTRAVERTLTGLRRGHIARLQGYLVRVEGTNFWWQSSLSREDTGEGACEVMFVEKADVIE